MSIKIASRGEVWLVNFDPTIGSEISKTRPAIIVNSDSLGILPVQIVVPVTGWEDRYAKNLWHIKIVNDDSNGLDKVSCVDVLQIRGISAERLIKKVGKVRSTIMEKFRRPLLRWWSINENGFYENENTRRSLW